MNISDIVSIKQGLIEVYPNQEQKPRLHHGLNVPANIYFYNISSKKESDDPGRFESKIRRWAGELPFSRFVYYDKDLQVLQIATSHF